MQDSTYYENFDPKRLMADFPLGERFLAKYVNMSQDELRDSQSKLFTRAVARAWQIPFYQRLWGNAGITAGDIRSIEDIHRLPSFGKQEIMESVARRPPFGDHHGREIPVDGRRVPMLLHTTSGTTGRPQPLVYSPKSREVQNLLLGRLYALQGVTGDDVVHSVYGHGLINGGHYIREAFTRYTAAMFLSAGTGVETPSSKQVDLMRDFGVTVLTGFGDYLTRLAQVAREKGLDPIKDIGLKRIIGHLTQDNRVSLAAAWGSQAEIFDWYGVGDTGAIAGEGPDHDGLHVMEDAQFLEICDIDTGEQLADGQTGDMVVTCLYIDDIFPIIRFNTHDVTNVLSGTSALKLPFRRIAGFRGRSDSMVKVKGINVFPQAIGNILLDEADFSGDYVCILTRSDTGQDVLTVHVECHSAETPERVKAYLMRLKQGLGVEVFVKLVPSKSLSDLTGIENRQKPIRLIDKR